MVGAPYLDCFIASQTPFTQLSKNWLALLVLQTTWGGVLSKVTFVGLCTLKI